MEIASHHWDQGEINLALKLFSQAREYTTTQHANGLHTAIIHCNMLLGDYNSAIAFCGMLNTDKMEPMEVANLECMRGLAYINTKQFRKAAKTFVSIYMRHFQGQPVSVV